MNYAPQDDQRVIYHEGVAEDVDGRTAVVRFVQNGACGSCTLKSVCNPAEQRVRTVTAAHDGTVAPGDRVQVGVAESVAWLSILFSFVFPFLVVATTFFYVYLRGGNDIAAGLLSIAALPLYYLLIYLNRQRFRSKVQFTVLSETARTHTPLRGLS